MRSTRCSRQGLRVPAERQPARALFFSSPLQKNFENIQAKCPHLKYVVNEAQLKDLLATANPEAEAVPTLRDEMCFWLYSSGSTGAPKGTVHLHSHLIATADLYAKPVLGIRESDVVFSAAKLFFAYGLGNSLTFPLAVGATTVLMAERPTPDSVFKRLVEKKPTIFYGVPTLYAALLASSNFRRKTKLPCASPRVKRCRPRSTSAGPSAPAQSSWTASARPRCCTSSFQSPGRRAANWKPVPGYQLRLVDDQGHVVTKPGELGELQISGPTSAIMYWNQREKTKNTFQGPWTRSGDKYSVDKDGYYVYGGRSMTC